MRYTDLYKTGIKHLDSDLMDIVEHLNSGESVCLCSPNMGDSRLIDYLAYYLESRTDYHFVYDSNGQLTTRDIESYLNSSKNDRKLILIPHYEWKGKKFHEYFKMRVSYKQELLTVIGMEYDFLKSPDKYFDSGRPMSYVKLRKPLNFKLSQSVIESRRYLDRWVVPVGFERKIFELSGGIIGLIKHICGYIEKFEQIDMDELICYPPVVRVLANLKTAFDILDEIHLQQLGYIHKDGKVRGELLSRYLRSGSRLNNFGLSSTLEKLLELFLDRKDQLVTLEEVDQYLNFENDFSLWGTYKLISRLRSAIKDKYELQNIKGKGYILKDREYDKA